MINRRSLLTSLGGLPFLGFLKEKKRETLTIAEDMTVNTTFNLQQCFCSCSISPNIHDDKCPNFGNFSDEKPEVEIIITMNHNGQRFKLKTISDNLTWEAS